MSARIVITPEALAAIKSAVLPRYDFHQTAKETRDGNWMIELQTETFTALCEFAFPHEDWSDTIIRLVNTAGRSKN